MLRLLLDCLVRPEKGCWMELDCFALVMSPSRSSQAQSFREVIEEWYRTAKLEVSSARSLQATQ